MTEISRLTRGCVWIRGTLLIWRTRLAAYNGCGSTPVRLTTVVVLRKADGSMDLAGLEASIGGTREMRVVTCVRHDYL